jgi:tetratricopeptide (TPR) repeat protein
VACPSDDTIAAFALRRLPDDETRAFLEHLEGCPACSELVAALPRSAGESPDIALEPTLATPAVAADRPLAAGERLGRFVIEGRIGAGGMGVVYRATDLDIGRSVAIKLLRSPLADGRAQVRIVREAKAMARLNHPNIVPVFAVGALDDRPYVVMELVAGVTLREWLAGAKRSWREVLDILVDAGRGLAAAHAAGIVHRDVKPANVLVGADGRPRVCDFGLARGRDDIAGAEPASAARPPAHVTQTGALIGTPAYMSPEQERGERATAMSDQYGFCVSAWEALHGERPAGHPPAPRRSRIPARVDAVLARGLAPTASDRHASMDDLLDALARARSAGRGWVVAAGAAFAAAVAGLVLVAGLGADPCAGVAERLRPVWSPARAAELQRAFAATGHPAAGVTAAATTRLLDAYADTWVSHRRAACAAIQTPRREAAELVDARVTCLDQRLRDLDAVVGVLAAVDRAAVARAASAVKALPAVSDCDRPLAQLGGIPEPPASVRMDVAAAATQRTIGAALVATGKPAEGIARLRAVVDTARRLAYPPLEARALMDLGATLLDEGQTDEARQTFLVGVAVAEEARDDRTKAVLWIGLGLRAAYMDRYLEEAQQYMRQADAALTRVENGGGNVTRDRAKVANAKALVYNVVGQHAEADRWVNEAIATMERAEHAEVDVAKLRVNHGMILTGMGRPAEAEAEIVAALALYARTLPESDSAVGTAWNDLGKARIETGDAEGAIAAQRTALDLAEKYGAPESIPVGAARLNLAEALVAGGRAEEAAALVERALAVFRRTVPDNSPYVARAHHTLGKALVAAGRPADGVVALERALALREAARTVPWMTAQTRLALAEGLWRTGDARALALVEAARAQLEAAGRKRDVAEADRLLARMSRR